MNKKKKMAVLIGILAGALLLCALVSLFFIRKNLYLPVLKTNWDLSFTKEDLPEELYQKKSDSGFLGDGLRYHVYQVRNVSEIKKRLAFKEEQKPTVFFDSYEKAIEEWLTKLQVKKEFLPETEKCLYYYSVQEDDSELLLLLDEKQEKLYILESFL